MCSDEIREDLAKMLQESIRFHQKWLRINIAFTPLSFLIFLLPGPGNFVFYWNLFRLYSHLQAIRGANSLLWALSSPSGITLPDGTSVSPQKLVQMKPNKDLDAIANPQLVLRHPVAKEPLSNILTNVFHLKFDQIQSIFKQRLSAIEKSFSEPPPSSPPPS